MSSFLSSIKKWISFTELQGMHNWVLFIMLPGHWCQQPVRFSTLSAIISCEICWLIVKLWLIDCCDSFLSRNSHMANCLKSKALALLPYFSELSSIIWFMHVLDKQRHMGSFFLFFLQLCVALKSSVIGKNMYYIKKLMSVTMI